MHTTVRSVRRVVYVWIVDLARGKNKTISTDRRRIREDNDERSTTSHVYYVQRDEYSNVSFNDHGEPTCNRTRGEHLCARIIVKNAQVQTQ